MFSAVMRRSAHSGTYHSITDAFECKHSIVMYQVAQRCESAAVRRLAFAVYLEQMRELPASIRRRDKITHTSSRGRSKITDNISLHVATSCIVVERDC